MAKLVFKFLNLKKLKRKRFLGFTLIELVIVVSIVSIITGIGASSYISTTKTARDNRRKTDLETVRQALELYKADNGEYPNVDGCTDSSGLNDLQPLLANYIRADQFPQDPKNLYSYCYSRDTVNPRKYLICAYLEKLGAALPVASPTPSPTPLPSVSPSPSPPATCNATCTTTCAGGLVCSSGKCRNAACTADTDCICSPASPTPSPTGYPSPSATPVLSPSPSPVNFTFYATDDAYLENTTRFNNSDLRVENSATRVRTSYLKFNVSGFTQAQQVQLILRNTDTANRSGTYKVSLGSHSSWTETNLSDANKPTPTTQLAIKTGTVAIGTDMIFDVTTGITAPGVYTLILHMDLGAGNDIKLSSDEGSVRPRLVVSGVLGAYTGKVCGTVECNYCVSSL